MVVFPNCKINIGLHIVSKRPDGYHNIETVFYPVRWHDALEVITAKEGITEVQLSLSGIPINAAAESNICVMAWKLLKKDFPALPAVNIHLHKAIPSGAGLGGGSADGANMLLLLNRKYQLGLSTERLLNYSLQLGSDCPIFIINQPAFASGRGEVLKPLDLDLSSYSMLFVNPRIHINTGWAFSRITPQAAPFQLNQVTDIPVTEWRHYISNDFEKPVLEAHPEIAAIKYQLYLKGALYASMSGSGSTIYGIFPKNEEPDLQLPPSYIRHFIA